ncbi:MAG: M3 family oligoendopeptidase [Fusobacteriaceae bacterium]|nr:M3 family oligoendopeptidase [Fusobacteriaceae bacterium]MBN2838401.1 M3 family oligoendopeptidase [Fusobacteriaceae bacterium]
MNYKWNLDKLYLSFEDENLKKDLNLLPSKLDDFLKWSNENLSAINTENLEEFLKKKIEVSTIFEKIYSFGQLSYTVNVKDINAKKLIELCEKLFVKFTELDVIFTEALKNCDKLQNIIDSSMFLKEHSFILNEIKESSTYVLSKKEELAIEKIKNTGSRTWAKLQDTLTATLMIEVEVDGKQETLPLSSVRNLAYDNSQVNRKNAYFAELNAYKKIEEPISFALNSIKGEALEETEMRGYDSILQRTLLDSRLKKETLEAMLEALKDNLPIFEKFLLKKSQILGHKNGLPFYDLFAPVGNANITFTEEDSIKFIIENFSSFSHNLGNFAKKAFAENWVDFSPKEGKVGGAFCQNLQSIGESRVLTNFTGSFSDVSTLAHELGHAYHGYALNNESYLNTNYSMPIAETASIFCETIVKNAILKTASKEEKLFILEQDISDSLQVIVDIYSRYIFESEVIEKRKNGSLDVENFKEIMLNSQKSAYLNGLDHEFLHPYMWVCKGHYYEASLNFYNFPYAFGLLFSKGLYALYLEQGNSFIEKYDKLLSITGKNNIEDVVASIGIDITNKEFWKNSLKLIENSIDEFIKL